jgi:predicted PurR-regulated permease PerM
MSITNNQWEFNLAIKLFILLSIIVLLFMGQTLFVPLTIAIFFTFLLYPISRKLERYKVPRAIAIIISLLIAIIFFGGIVYFFIQQLNSFRDDLPELKTQLATKGGRVLEWIESRTRISPDKQINWLKEKLSSSQSGTAVIVGIFSTTGTFLAMFALIPIYVFFLTYFREKYKQFIILVSKENHEQALDIIKKISKVSKNYLKGVFLDVLILSVLGSIGYLLLDIKHAVLFGVLAAILNIIPYIGVLMGSLMPILMALITKDELGYAVGALGVAVVVQFIDNNFISPYVVGSSVSLNPMTALIVLIIGALVWGIAGMVLSIPIAGMIKVVFDNIDSLKPYGYLIGEEVNFYERGFFHKKKTD